MNGMQLNWMVRRAWLPFGFLLACGPSLGGTGGGTSNDSTSTAESSGHFEVSWALGTFTMPKVGEPAGMFMTLEISEEGHAVATLYNCDIGGGPATPDYVTPLEWRAISETVLEVIPPMVGEKFLYGSERVDDLFIERKMDGDGIIVYSSRTNSQWPHYGNFERGRACEYFLDGMSCLENHYYRICSE